MRQIILRLTNRLGLHAQPSACLAVAAAGFDSVITVRNVTTKSEPVDAKSIFAVMRLYATRGHQIEIVAKGVDEDEAIATLQTLMQDNFCSELASPTSNLR